MTTTIKVLVPIIKDWDTVMLYTKSGMHQVIDGYTFEVQEATWANVSACETSDTPFALLYPSEEIQDDWLKMHTDNVRNVTGVNLKGVFPEEDYHETVCKWDLSYSETLTILDHLKHGTSKLKVFGTYEMDGKMGGSGLNYEWLENYVWDIVNDYRELVENED